MTLQEFFFPEKDSGRKDSLSKVVWTFSKFDSETPDTYNHVIGGLKVFEWHFTQTRMSRNQKRAKNTPFSLRCSI